MDARPVDGKLKCQTRASVIGYEGFGGRAWLLEAWTVAGSRDSDRVAPAGRGQKARAENRLLDINQIKTLAQSPGNLLSSTSRVC